MFMFMLRSSSPPPPPVGSGICGGAGGPCGGFSWSAMLGNVSHYFSRVGGRASALLRSSSLRGGAKRYLQSQCDCDNGGLPDYIESLARERAGDRAAEEG